MRSIVVGKKYWMTTPQGVRVIVIAKEVDGDSASSMGFVRVEIEASGLLTHVKKSKLREIKSSYDPKGKRPRIYILSIFIVLAALFVLMKFLTKFM